MSLTREQILEKLLDIFEKYFEIENPDPDDDLREEHEFDSIDAIELLVEIEKMLGFSLTQEEKKEAMNIRTINDIIAYIQSIEAGKNP